MAKKFKDLKEEDSLWYLNPITQSVDALKIREVKGIPPEEARKHEGLKYYVSIEAYRNDLIVQSMDIDKIHTIKFYLDGRLETQMAVVNVQVGKEYRPMPTLYSTSKDLLVQFTNAEAQVTKRKYNG